MTEHCQGCLGTLDHATKHFCPRCAKCDAIIQAGRQHRCRLKKVNKTALRKPLVEGGIIGARIKIGKVHFVIRAGVGGQIVLHPVGVET